MKAQEQIEKLKTLQESLDSLSNTYKELTKSSGNIVLSDVADGKKQIADAINIKGGEASADSSFSKLAEDIGNLNDSFITYGVTAEPKIDWLQFICNRIYDTRSGLQEINRDDIEEISIPYIFSRCTNLRRVVMNGVKSISGSYTFASCPLLQHIEFNELEKINADYIFSSAGIGEINFPNLRSLGAPDVFRSSGFNKIQADNLLNLTQGSLTACLNLTECIFPNVNSLDRQIMTSTNNVVNIVFGTIISCNGVQSIGSKKTRNITIGQDTDVNLYFNTWTATSVIAEGQSGIDELNNNLYNNLLTKLYDHSTDGQTRTLHLGWLAHVSQENIDYANSKGWTLTT